MFMIFNPAREAPTIETEPLRMRAYRLDDFKDYAAMWADPAAVRYVGGKPFSKEEVWAKMLRYVGHWSLMSFGYWAIEEKANRDHVGEIGFADFKRDIQPSLAGMPELGWVFISLVH